MSEFGGQRAARKKGKKGPSQAMMTNRRQQIGLSLFFFILYFAVKGAKRSLGLPEPQLLVSCLSETRTEVPVQQQSRRSCLGFPARSFLRGYRGARKLASSFVSWPELVNWCGDVHHRLMGHCEQTNKQTNKQTRGRLVGASHAHPRSNPAVAQKRSAKVRLRKTAPARAWFNISPTPL